jgi:hypothetical protein
MVFVSPDFSGAMKDGGSPSGREIGYAFALPRLIARLCGRRVRRAELSRWEAYGLGILVFGISFVYVAHTILPKVRPTFAQFLVLLLLPFAVWVAFLLLYYVNSLMTDLLRRFGLYSAITNNQFQHFVIMSLTTLLALLLVWDESGWMRSLGIFWFGLLSLNLISILLLKFFHEP